MYLHQIIFCLLPEPPEADCIIGVGKHLRHGLQRHPTKAHGSHENTKDPETNIENYVHRAKVAAVRGHHHRGRVHRVERTHAAPGRVGTEGTAGTTTPNTGDERERVDEEDGHECDDHQELGEVRVMVWRGALKKLRGQKGHLATHAVLHGSRLEQSRWTGLTTCILQC